MIPSSHALVSLKPARQAAIQAISHVESARERGARLPAMPYVRTFLRLLTGSGRLNATVANKIPGTKQPPFEPETGRGGTQHHDRHRRGSLPAAAHD